MKLFHLLMKTQMIVSAILLSCFTLGNAVLLFCMDYDGYATLLYFNLCCLFSIICITSFIAYHFTDDIYDRLAKKREEANLLEQERKILDLYSKEKKDESNND